MPLPKNLKLTDLILAGEGAQGKVYLLDDHRCVKVYYKSKYFYRELASLKRAAAEPTFPRLYEWDNNYIIREFIPGMELNRYLENYPLTKDLAAQLLEIYHAFKRLGFKRLDSRIDHIIITPEHKLRLIDPTNAMKHTELHPNRLLTGLAAKGYRERFLEYVKQLDPDLWSAWR